MIWNYKPVGGSIRGDFRRRIFRPIEAYGWVKYKDKKKSKIV
jgi:hypothetical protein